MKTGLVRIILLFLCVVLPAGAMAESITSAAEAVHAEFTLGVDLHADAFPPGDLHGKDWETFLNRLTLAGSLDAKMPIQPNNRFFMDAALYLDGEETIPFIMDVYAARRYMISPMFRGDPLQFDMHNYIEFMMKFYYYLGLPSNYIALLTYPDTFWYVAERYYTPFSAEIADRRAAALELAGDETPEVLTYKITYDRMITLCNALNSVATKDMYKRVRWFLTALLAELYLSDVVLEALSHLDLAYQALDPGMEGLTMTETVDSLVCTIGEHEIFSKKVTGDVTVIAFTLSLPDEYAVSLSYRGETVDNALNVTADFSVTEGEDSLFWVSLDGVGLPAKGSPDGEGQLSIVLGGSVIGEPLTPQTIGFAWSSTAAELPFDIDLSLSWLHPQTGLPALTANLSAALNAADTSVFTDKTYPEEHVFWLNSTQLEEYKHHWANSIVAYLLPVGLSMPVGVIDDVVGFLLDSDILLSLTD